MPANTSPIFTLTPNVGTVNITAANTKSDGTGTGVGTDIFKAFTAGSNGSFVSRVRLNPVATTAATTTTATIGRVFYSTTGSGATTGGTNTWLIGEVTLPSVSADSSSAPTNPIEVMVNAAIPTGSFIHVTTHAAPAANSSWQATVFGGDYQTLSDMGFFFGAQHPNQQVFYANMATGATQTWEVWDKPRGCTLVYLFLLGSGGGGGGGLTGAASAARGGGGGGGSAGIAVATAPASLIPDRLYLAVAKGGAGSTGSTVAGSAGSSSYVSPYPATGVSFFQAGSGNGGAAGTAAGSAAGGTAVAGSLNSGLIAGAFSARLASGATGATGGIATGGAGTSAQVGASAAGTSPGAGGGGSTSADFTGGSQTSPSTAWIPSVSGAAAGSTRGTDGYWSWGPQFVGGLGGTGGGAANSSAGGVGGNGAYGCGGGGGGAGTTGAAGGAGGDGLIIIVAI